MQARIRLLKAACLIGFTTCGSAFAAAPAEQSKCEIESNKYWAIHINDKPDFKNFRWPAFPRVFSLDAGIPAAVAPYQDATSGITFSVEKDGRHITATDAGGKLLWRRNPFVDFGMCPYRSPHPYIQWIGAPEGGNGPGPHLDSPSTAKPDAMTNAQIVKTFKNVKANFPVPKPRAGDRFIGLAFNSSQFGYLSIRKGDFYFAGQN